MQVITKFNRLIRSRILWGALTVLIGIVFVGFFTQLPQKESHNAEGRLFGKWINQNEFYHARYFAMGLREHGSMKASQLRTLRRRTWQRLALMDTARQMGIVVADEEMARTIQQAPGFTVNGVFNENRYKAMVEKQYRVDVPVFESYLREELTLAKLNDLMRAAVWTSPSEMDRHVRDYADQFALEYTVMTPLETEASTNITRETIQEYFDAHKRLFAIPRRVSVRYVEFPISNYLGKVVIKDSEIQEYYENHQEDFSVQGTNDTASVRPLAEVQTNILNRLTREAAHSEAKKQATDVVMAMAPGRYEQALTFDELAAKMGLTIRTSAFFSATEQVPGLEVDRTFNKAACDLDPSDSQRYFSDAISGDKSVYVLATNTNTPARVPEFAEVADLVRPLAQSNANHQAFVTKARAIRDAVGKSLENGKTFRAAVREFNLNVSTTRPFTVYEARMASVYGQTSNTIAYADELVPVIMPRAKGELTDPVGVADGILLAYVADRSPGDLAAADFLRLGLQQDMERPLTSLVLDDWSDHLLAQAGFEDLHPLQATDEEGREPEPPEEDADGN